MLRFIAQVLLAALIAVLMIAGAAILSAIACPPPGGPTPKPAAHGGASE